MLCCLLWVTRAHADVTDYSLNITGGGTIEQGHALHLFLDTEILSGSINFSDYANLTVTGLPANSDLRFVVYPGGVITSDTVTPYTVDPIGFNPGQNFFEFETTALTPVGTYALTYTVTSSLTHITHSLQRTVHVVPPSFYVPSTQPFPPPTPIPQLSAWEQNMIYWGNFNCTQIPSLGPVWQRGAWEASVWFYDGEAVYKQIAAYTNNPTVWNPCGLELQSGYQAAITANANQFFGLEVFTKGLRMNYEQTHDPGTLTTLSLDMSRGHLGEDQPLTGPLP